MRHAASLRRICHCFLKSVMLNIPPMGQIMGLQTKDGVRPLPLILITARAVLWP